MMPSSGRTPSREAFLVVGAGLGGLATACFLQQSGRTVTVIERQRAFPPAVPGLLLHANALRVLASLGLDEEIVQQGVLLRGAVLLDEQGRTLSEVSFDDEIRAGQRTLGVRYEVLHAALRARLPEADVRLGLTASSFNVADDHIDAYFSDGQHARFALVIGADGRQSRVRELILGPTPSRPLGSVIWRTLLPLPPGLAPDRTGEVLGAGVRVGWVPVSDGQLYVFLMATAAPDDESLRALDHDGVRARFAHLGGPVPALLASLTSDAPLIFDEVFDRWLDHWSRRRFVLIGDAAHTVAPTLAQGTAMALEDAKALQFCLDTQSAIPEALEAFEQLRRPRVKAIHDASYEAGRIHQWTLGPAVALRNLLYRMLPSSSARTRLRTLIDEPSHVHPFVGHRPDLPPACETSLQLVRYLVKIGQVDGRFDDRERAFIQASFQARGEQVTLEQLQALSLELHRTPLAEVLAPFRDADLATREQVLALGHLAALANGHVAARELEALAEVRDTLGLDQATFDRIVAGS